MSPAVRREEQGANPLRCSPISTCKGKGETVLDEISTTRIQLRISVLRWLRSPLSRYLIQYICYQKLVVLTDMLYKPGTERPLMA